jgi:hypothetical protein
MELLVRGRRGLSLTDAHASEERLVGYESRSVRRCGLPILFLRWRSRRLCARNPTDGERPNKGEEEKGASGL